MLDIFVREALTARTLRQSDSLPKSFIVGLAVRRIEIADGIPTFDTDGHDALSNGQGDARVAGR